MFSVRAPGEPVFPLGGAGCRGSFWFRECLLSDLFAKNCENLRFFITFERLAARVPSSSNTAEGCILGKTSIACRTGGGKIFEKKVRVSGFGVWLLCGGRRPPHKSQTPQPETLTFFSIFLRPPDIAQWEGRCRRNPV